MKKPLWLAALAVSTALTGAAYLWHERIGAAVAAVPAPAAPPTVIVAAPVYRPVQEWDTYSARFAATDTVQVSSRVSGHLTAVHFDDGQIVREGDLLFTIDPRPYQAELHLAEASLGEARARVTLARQQLARTETLVAKGHVSKARHDQDRAEMNSALAAYEAAEAHVEEAKLNLDYTEIRAPISGRIDNRYVDIGNLVMGVDAEATVLTTIVALDPIHVVFDVDQNALLRYIRLDREGKRQSSRDAANPVRIALPDMKTFDYEGRMDFVSNRIDTATGTIRGRAVVANPDHIFTPGMFARVRLLSRADQPAVLIPDAAIAVEQANTVVLVVDAENRVESRIVTTGPLVDGLRMIRSGLAPDERVIVEGLHRARPGTEVTPKVRDAETVTLAEVK